MSDRCEVHLALAGGGHREPRCRKVAVVDLQVKATGKKGVYDKTFGLCEPHALRILRAAVPNADEFVVELEGGLEITYKHVTPL